MITLIVPFNKDKIADALTKAFNAIEGKDNKTAVNKVTSCVAKRITKSIISIEEIQDFVETELLLNDYKHIHDGYNKYRNLRKTIRENELRKKFKISSFRITKNKRLYVSDIFDIVNHACQGDRNRGRMA